MSGSDEDAVRGGRGGDERSVVVKDRRRNEWFRVDNVIIDGYGQVIGSAALALYAVLCRRANNDTSSCNVRVSRLCLDSGIKDPRTLRKHLRILQEYGLIAVVPVYGALGQHANEYVILEPPKVPERRPLQILPPPTKIVRGPLQNSIGGRGTKNVTHKKNRVKEEPLEGEESRLSAREVNDVIREMEGWIASGHDVDQVLHLGYVDAAKWSAAIATSIGRAEWRRVKGDKP